MDLLSLLKNTTAPLIELTDFFTSIGPQRAERARKVLEKKDPGCGAFYSELLIDLTELGTNLDALHTDVEMASDDVQGIRELLAVIEQHFVASSDGEREAYDYLYPVEHEFPILTFVLELLHDQQPEDDRRTDWLCEHVRLEHPTKKGRKVVFPALARCRESFRKYMPSSASGTDEPPGQVLEREWEDAKVFYADLRRFHEDLNTCWTCNCHVPHRLAKFSFDYLPDSQDGSVECLLCYPHDKHDKTSYIWQPARMQYRRHESSESRMLDPSSAARYTHAIHRVLPQTRLHSTSDTLCELLQASKNGHSVQLAAKIPKLTLSRQARRDSASYDSCQGLCEPTYLLEWLRHSNPMSFKKVSKRYRFALALRLSYDFLFLGGGPWWPYDRVSDDRASSVCFFDVEDAPEDAIQRPFFTSSLPDITNTDTVPHLLRLYNKHMPSLPVFGKLLLELVTGRYVDWGQLEDELERYSKKMCGTEVVNAVKACLSMGNDKTFRDGGLISQDRRLRDHFLNEVVLTIQRVVRVGYQLTVSDVFNLSSSDRWSDTASSISRSPRRPSTSPSGSQFGASPTRASTPALLSQESTRTSLQLETDFEGLCLHDGDRKETLDLEDAASSAEWTELLKSCVETVLPSRERPGQHARHVRIAVLDTGASIPQHLLENLYDNRLVECRTWLDSWADEGKPFDANCDEDGHGTHGTSVLLGATAETDIEIYAAQVFRNRTEQVQRDRFASDSRSVWAVQKAIYHAVNEWKVDIISMSFGFPEAPPEVEQAVKYARNNNVLLLAAASNCGANKAVTWPANDESVISIYATSGEGNRYLRNPTPGPGRNFATLGTSVLALWPPDAEDVSKWVHKSGTSTATPMAAGIASLIIQVMETRKDAYLASQKARGRSMPKITDAFCRKLDKLRTKPGMSAVFQLMVGDEGKRDHYDYIAPWRLFKREDTDHYMVQQILNAIRV